MRESAAAVTRAGVPVESGEVDLPGAMCSRVPQHLAKWYFGGHIRSSARTHYIKRMFHSSCMTKALPEIHSAAEL